jgi:hypothetical protein
MTSGYGPATLAGGAHHKADDGKAVSLLLTDIPVKIAYPQAS